MYSTTREITFRARHWVAIGGQKEAAHEHNWRVRATVETKELDQSGMVMDFAELRSALRSVVEPLTHVDCINELEGFHGKIASTELLAYYLFDLLAIKLPDNVVLAEVTVWETANCCASYRP